MANDEYSWDEGMFNDGTDDRRQKRKKDPYDNPLGFSGETPGIIADTQDITRQSQETDNAIGRAATQQNKPLSPVTIPAVLDVKPQTRVTVEPVQTDTGKPALSGNLFNDRTGTVDLHPTEGEKREKNYEDSLTITGGNEGYAIPPVQTSKGSSESYPGEKEKLAEHSANDGFTIRDDTSELAAESKRRIEENAAFIGRFLKGNEEQKRFANGIPAPEEAYQSILGMAMDAKNRSDNAMQEDWAQSIKDRDKSEFGQGLRDIYHSSMAGGYEVGNEAATTLDLMEDAKSINNFMFMPAPYVLFDNQFNGRNYIRDVGGYSGYKLKKYFREKAKSHLDLRSQDNENASLDNPGYLSVKGAGEFMRELPHALAGAGLAARVKGGTAALIIGGVEGGMAAYTKRIDTEMDRLMAKPEAEMLDNPDYVRIRKVITEPEEARYIMAKEYARQGVLGDIFKGALKGMAGTAIGNVTRNGTEGLIFRTIQDVFGGMTSDIFVDGTVDYFKNSGNNVKNKKND